MSSTEVTPLELFFDLVLVFAITQVTSFLSRNPPGAARSQWKRRPTWKLDRGTASLRKDGEVAPSPLRL